MNYFILSLAFGTVFGQDARPNVVLFVVDDMGFNDVSFAPHNAEFNTTNTDALAAESVRLNNYYAQPICTPTRTCLLTGRHPIEAGLQRGVIVQATRQGLPLSFKLLPEHLSELGYQTHLVGKWHLGSFDVRFTPDMRGFDTFFGYYSGQEDYFNHSIDGFFDFRNNQAIDRSVDGTYGTFLLADQAEEIIRNHDASKGPLFLEIANQNPHVPDVQNPNFLEGPGLPRFTDPCSHIEDSNRALYCSMQMAMDEALLNITNVLKDEDLWDNTVFIYTSDNGAPVGFGLSGGSNFPLRGSKGSLFEGGTRAAAFVHASELTAGVNTDLISVCDWFLTIINLAGGKMDPVVPDGDQGKLQPFSFDVWNSLRGISPTKRRELLVNIDGPLRALRRGNFKLVNGSFANDAYFSPGNIEEPLTPNDLDGLRLYNVTGDPRETTNLADQFPEMVQTMLETLEEYEKLSMGPQPNDEDSRGINEFSAVNAVAPWLKGNVAKPPRNVVARTSKSGDSVEVSFTAAKVDDDSPPVLVYRVTVDGFADLFFPGKESPIIVTEVNNPDDFVFHVAAVNAIGSSQAGTFRGANVSEPARLSTGAIAGIVVGITAVVLVLIFVSYRLGKRSAMRKATLKHQALLEEEQTTRETS